MITPRPTTLTLVLLALPACFAPSGPDGAPGTTSTVGTSSSSDTGVVPPGTTSTVPTTGTVTTGDPATSTSDTTDPLVTSTGATTTTGDPTVPATETGTSTGTDATTGTAGTTGTTVGSTGDESSSTGCDAECLCGNGVVDAGEDCDDGNDIDVDDCTSACNEPACGDGFVWTGIEECDDGDQANGDSCSSGCMRVAWQVFVTKGQTKQLSLGELMGGLAQADDACQASADAAGLGGVYKAWLSSDEVPLAARFDNLQDATFPVIRTNGTAVASSMAALLQTGPVAPIDRDEFGMMVLGETVCNADNVVWTGTTPAGGVTPMNTCMNWTAKNGTGRVGYFKAVGMTGQWTDACSFACGGAARFYCFEQPQ